MAGSLLVLDSTTNSATMRSLRHNYHCVLIVSLSVGRQIFRAISFVWSIIAKPLFSGSVCIVVCIEDQSYFIFEKGCFFGENLVNS